MKVQETHFRDLTNIMTIFSCGNTVLQRESQPNEDNCQQCYMLKGDFFDFFLFYVRYLTLLLLPPLRFHCVGGCWDRTQDSCDYGLVCQTLQPLGQISSTTRPDLIHNQARSNQQLGQILSTTRLDLINNQARSHPQLGQISSIIIVVCSHLSSFRWCRRWRHWHWALHGNGRPAYSPAQPHPADPAVQMYHQCCGSGSGGFVINQTPGFGSIITDPDLVPKYLSKI